MIRSPGNQSHALMPARRQPATPVQAGGDPIAPTPALPNPPQPAQPSALMVAFQHLMSTLWSALGSFVAWLRSSISAPSTSTSISQPLGPMPAGTPSAPVATIPGNASVPPSPGMALRKGQVSAGVGLTQVDGQPGVGARVDARAGDTLVSGVATVSGTAEGVAATVGAQVTTPNLTADGAVRVDESGISAQGHVAGAVGEAKVLGTVVATPEVAAGSLVVVGPKVQGVVAGVVTKDSTALAGALAARVGEDGALKAEGLYRKGADGVHANLQAAYQDPTTEAGLRYAQEDETRAAGAYLNKRLPHSSLSLGAEYLWSSQGDGGRAYGRWQSDAIGETVGGFQVKGALEAGAVKLPGQDWNTYAAGRVTAEKANAALFAEVHHQAGPGFSQPDTALKFGAQFRF